MRHYRCRGILLAEDDPNEVELLKLAFEREHVVVRMDFVNDGDAAMNYLRGAAGFSDRARYPLPSLLLLDLKMPGRDGFDVLRWRHEDAVFRRLPVVVFSSSEEPRDVDLAHDLGVNGYVVKPNDFHGMQTFVRAVESFWLRCHCYPSFSCTTGSRSGISSSWSPPQAPTA